MKRYNVSDVEPGLMLSFATPYVGAWPVILSSDTADKSRMNQQTAARKLRVVRRCSPGHDAARQASPGILVMVGRSRPRHRAAGSAARVRFRRLCSGQCPKISWQSSGPKGERRNTFVKRRHFGGRENDVEDRHVSHTA